MVERLHQKRELWARRKGMRRLRTCCHLQTSAGNNITLRHKTSGPLAPFLLFVAWHGFNCCVPLGARRLGSAGSSSPSCGIEPYSSAAPLALFIFTVICSTASVEL